MPFRCHPLRLCECRCRPLQLLRPLFQLNSILLFQFSSMSLGCAPLRCFVAICFSSSNQSKSLVLLPISSSFTFYFLLSVIYMSFFSSLYTAPFCLPRLPTQPCFMRSAPLGHSHVPRQRLTVSVFLCLLLVAYLFFISIIPVSVGMFFRRHPSRHPCSQSACRIRSVGPPELQGVSTRRSYPICAFCASGYCSLTTR